MIPGTTTSTTTSSSSSSSSVLVDEGGDVREALAEALADHPVLQPAAVVFVDGVDDDGGAGGQLGGGYCVKIAVSGQINWCFRGKETG